ncbi:putative ubiquinol-cytochrome c reductase cytochrome c subunit [Pilimelia terevasa]|uniref:Cytochrome bc1 complex cytochrome c subunit n=1 Tax=Pilimelia terevasa TaxID=53372 RepID=A0A8J3FK43_9ACTN|nr:c-type cytochrome [Pilimelia terevasa]GGK26563.1 putative ubiquinol-cytochrome c reductase cytochrome c subunit [Pilimelia terevasa]
MTSDNPGRGAAATPPAGAARRRAGATAAGGRLRRRVGTVLRIAAALALAGGVYAGFAPGSATAAKDPASLSPAGQEGKALFDTNCTSCHGPDAQGVAGKGPSLVGVGAASVEFQVSSGRMPMARQEAQALRKRPVFTYDQTRQLAQYVQELGGGPQIPEGSMKLPGGTPEEQAAAVARGGTLFRINCASCHANAGGGGALSSGKFAPDLEPANDRQIYAAMLTGPQNMPVFGDNQLTPEQKREIIAYVHTLKAQEPGGWGLGKLGPVTEGMAIFLLGMTALIFTTLWIAGKS